MCNIFRKTHVIINQRNKYKTAKHVFEKFDGVAFPVCFFVTNFPGASLHKVSKKKNEYDNSQNTQQANLST